jgi:hypothetical protein
VADCAHCEGLNFVIYKVAGPNWYQRMTADALAGHKAINSVFKRFKVLSMHYCHGIVAHETTFTAIDCVTNAYLDRHPTLQVR